MEEILCRSEVKYRIIYKLKTIPEETLKRIYRNMFPENYQMTRSKMESYIIRELEIMSNISLLNLYNMIFLKNEVFN